MSKLQSFQQLNTPFHDAWNVFLQQNPSNDEITQAFFTPYNLTHLNGGNVSLEKVLFLQDMIRQQRYQPPKTWDQKPLQTSKLVLCCLFQQPLEINMSNRTLVHQARELYQLFAPHERGLQFLDQLVHSSRNNEAVFAPAMS